MESKKNLQFNDDFENFYFMFLSFTWSNRTADKFSFISHFLVYHKERAREIVGLMAAPSVLETGNISSQWLSFLPSQILIELELSQEVNSWQGLPVASKFIRYGLRAEVKKQLGTQGQEKQAVRDMGPINWCEKAVRELGSWEASSQGPMNWCEKAVRDPVPWEASSQGHGTH